MYPHPDCFARPPRRLHPTGLWASVALAMFVAGCASPGGQGLHEAASQSATPPVAASPVLCQPVTPVATAAPLGAGPILGLLAYAERVRRMQPTEWSQEVTRLGDVSNPADQVQLALVLSQFRQAPELMRAQDLLGRVLANTSTEAQALHPLVGLLAARFGEQRRLEELLDKQSQQTREVQRRLDQTTDRLEALKAIERSLTSRPPQAPASNSRGSHTPAP